MNEKAVNLFATTLGYGALGAAASFTRPVNKFLAASANKSIKYNLITPKHSLIHITDSKISR